jgi:hypothetical protein
MDESEICCSTHGDGKPDVPCLHSPTGLIRDRYQRMDRHDADSYGSLGKAQEVPAIADSSIGRVVRFDLDDPLSAAARAASKRIFLQGVRNDEREKAEQQFKREMAQREWLEQFRAARLAELSAEGPAPDLGAAAAAAERRINEQWRPKS